MDLDITKQNLEKIIQKIQSKDITLVLSGMQIYENLGPEYVIEFRLIYPALSQKYNLPLIPFFLEGVAGNPDLNIQDQIHPNAKGYKIIIEENIWPTLEKLL